MADEDMAAPPAPEMAAPGTDEPLQTLELSILSIVKGLQNEHGLRHGDYERYRAYCARRLAKVRKAVGINHGGRRFAKKSLEPAHYANQRFLHIPLLNAERAWSLAMHLKRQGPTEGRTRQHMIRRFAKAARWARELHAACTQRCDQRTTLESEAYAAWMAGNHSLERESWAPALRSFFRARAIYTELSRVSLLAQQQLFSDMVEEIQPIVRYCRYQLQSTGAGAEEDGAAEEDELSIVDILKDDAHNLASNMLRSRLEPMLAELQAKQAATHDQVVFRGQAIPVTNEKLRVCILRSQNLMAQIEAIKGGNAPATEPPATSVGTVAEQPSGPPGLLDLFDELLVEDNDALDVIKADLKAQRGSSGAADGNLQLLSVCFQVRKLMHTMQRTTAMVDGLREREGMGKGTGAAKATTAEDVARVYSVVLQNLLDLSALLNPGEDGPMLEAVEMFTQSNKARRCLYLAASHASACKWAHARKLLDRSEQYAAEAQQLVDNMSMLAAQVDGVQEERHRIEALQGEIDRARCRVRAQSVLHTLARQQPEGLGDSDLGALNLEDRPPSAAAAQGAPELSPYVLDDLMAFKCTALAKPSEGLTLVAFPPEFEAVPCKPLLFDVAQNGIVLPDLSQYKKQQARGLFGRLLGL